MNEMIKTLRKNTLFSGGIVMVVGSMSINAFNYLYHLIMGRALGPGSYSVLASVFSLYYMIAIIPQSASVSIVKFVSETKDKKDLSILYSSLYKFINILALVLAFFITIFSPLITKFLHFDSFLLIPILAPITYFSLGTLLNQSVVQGLLSFKEVVSINLVAALGKLLLGLLFVILGFSAGGAVLGLAIATFITFFYSRRLISVRVNVVPERRMLSDFFKFSVPALFQALSFTFIFTVDLILVKHFFSEYDAGLYAALSTLGKIIFFASSPIAMVMFPAVSGRRARGESYRKVFYITFFATFLMAGGIVSFYYLFPEFAIKILYGSSYLAASTYLFWMGGFIAVYTLNYFLVNFLLSVGKVKVVAVPFLSSVLQIIAISLWHESLLVVIQISLAIMIFMMILLVLYLASYQYKIYGKK